MWKENLFKMGLAELELTVRSTNILEARGITTVGDLCEMTVDELSGIPSFDDAVLAEVHVKLSARDLRLRGD